MSSSGLNDQILSELDRFRQREGSAYYAIQLNAPWGAGKTTFIKSYLDAQKPTTNNGDEPKSLIITFFGSKNADDLDKQIVAQLFSDNMRTFGSVLSVAIGSISGIFKVDKAVDKATDGITAVMLERRMEAVKRGMIVFDDIERSDFPLKDAIGYMNRFVEDGFKVIVVSNDAAFASLDGKRSGDSANQDSERARLWRSFKEKLIGKTLKFTPEVSLVYAKLCESLKHERAKKVATDYAATVINLIYASGLENLRSVRMGLETFEQFVDLIEPSLVENDEGLSEILQGCIYVSLEVASASKVQNLINPSKTKLSRLMSGIGGRMPPEPTDDEKQMDEIAKRYEGSFNFRSPPIPLQYIADIVTSGSFDRKEIEEALKISPAFVEAAHVPAWRRLISIWTLDTRALEEGTRDAKASLNDLSISEPGELMHLASIMLWRKSHGDLTLSDDLEPVDYIKSYLQRLHEKGGRVALDRDGFGIDGLSAHGFQVLTGPTPEMKEIVTLLRSAMELTARENYPRYRDAFMKEIVSESRNLRTILYESGELSRYLKMPMFEDADPDEMVDAVFRNSAFDVELVQLLAERYQQGHQLGRLTAEGPWLRKLYDALIERSQKAPKPLGAFWKQLIEAHIGTLMPQTEEGEAPEAQGGASNDQAPDEPKDS